MALEKGPKSTVLGRYGDARRPVSGARLSDAACLHLSEQLQDGSSPDEDLLDLIELSFLDGQIDDETLNLAFAWLEGEQPVIQ